MNHQSSFDNRKECKQNFKLQFETKWKNSYQFLWGSGLCRAWRNDSRPTISKVHDMLFPAGWCITSLLFSSHKHLPNVERDEKFGNTGLHTNRPDRAYEGKYTIGWSAWYQLPILSSSLIKSWRKSMAFNCTCTMYRASPRDFLSRVHIYQTKNGRHFEL